MRKHRQEGFALVVTLALLALLVLATLAMSALQRVGAGVAASGASGGRARQHALLALNAALAQAQRLAGDDAAVTGMGGITAVAAGAGHPARHWCGVWDGGANFRGWLASGAPAAPSVPDLTGSDTLTLLADGSLGADGVDKEHVRALLLPIDLVDPARGLVRAGNCAWWVGDEGVKLSAVLGSSPVPVAGGRHAIDELIPALSPADPALDRVQAFQQLAFVPATALTPGPLQANLHVLSVRHERVASDGTVTAGLLNVNTSSARFWRGVAATYNRLKPADAPTLATAGFGAWMRDHFPAVDAAGDKAAGAPYRTVELFLGGDVLAAALDANGGTLQDFAAVLRPWLTTRSDTFRIRAYGDVRNAVDPGVVESVAWCEAIIQRSPAALPGFGRRFVITYFRWLGPDDV